MKEKTLPEPPSCNLSDPDWAAAFASQAVEALRSKGFRVTRPRVQVIRVLAETNAALSPNAIHERIAESGNRIDAASVYRILSTLQDVGLVHRIGIVDGYFACRSSEDGEHHAEHLVCRVCGCVTELAAPARTVDSIAEGARTSDFFPSVLRIEVLGTCGHCRSAVASGHALP